MRKSVYYVIIHERLAFAYKSFGEEENFTKFIKVVKDNKILFLSSRCSQECDTFSRDVFIDIFDEFCVVSCGVKCRDSGEVYGTFTLPPDEFSLSMGETCPMRATRFAIHAVTHTVRPPRTEVREDAERGWRDAAVTKKGSRDGIQRSPRTPVVTAQSE